MLAHHVFDSMNRGGMSALSIERTRALLSASPHSTRGAQFTGTRLLKWDAEDVPSANAEEVRWRNAVHEAGHLLADLVNFLGPYEVNLATGRGAATHSCVVAACGEEAMRLASSLLSGAAAERAAGFDDEETLAGEASDLARLDALKLTEIDRQRCFEDAKRFATEHAQEILRVAKALLEKDVTRGGVLYQVLRHPVPAGEWFGRIEALEDPRVPNALVVFDGTFDGEFDADVSATPIDPANGNRLRTLTGRSDLFLTAVKLDDSSCSAMLAEIQEGEAPCFVLLPFRTES